MKLKDLNISFTNDVVTKIGNIPINEGDRFYIKEDNKFYIVTGKGNIAEYFTDKDAYEWFYRNPPKINYEESELLAIRMEKYYNYSYRTCYSEDEDLTYYDSSNNMFNFNPTKEVNSPCGYRNKPVEVPEDIKALGLDTGFHTYSWCDSSD